MEVVPVGTLDSICVDLAASLSTAWRLLLSSPVIVEFHSIEELSYADFIAQLPPHACISVLNVDPPGVQILVDIRSTLLFPMIDRLLGGNAGSIPHRALTQTEQAVVLQIVERAAASIADTFSGTEPLIVREEELSNDPPALHIMPADEMVTVMRMSATLASNDGIVSVCLPAPVVSMLGGEVAIAPDRQQDAQNLHQNIMQSAVELRALLAETKLRLDDVLSMQVGDVITTETPPDAPVRVQMNGKDILEGRLGQIEGKRVVEITKPSPAGERGA